MKVGTDSLVLGSWAQTGHASNILDIGTGTGILALMMAQKNKLAHITAIDIDDDAVRQAKANVAGSLWSHRIEVVKADVAAFQSQKAFDVIISNPPYFHHAASPTNAFDNAKDKRLTARQDETLTPGVLFFNCSRLLKPVGQIYCVYPATRHREVVDAAATQGFYLSACLEVTAAPGRSPYLHGLCFSSSVSTLRHEQLVVRDENNVYTPEYKRLCEAFYLNF